MTWLGEKKTHLLLVSTLPLYMSYNWKPRKYKAVSPITAAIHQALKWKNETTNTSPPMILQPVFQG